jgi:hypothetical protein
MNYAFKANKCRLFLQFENHFFLKSLKNFSIYLYFEKFGFFGVLIRKFSLRRIIFFGFGGNIRIIRRHAEKSNLYL